MGQVRSYYLQGLSTEVFLHLPTCSLHQATDPPYPPVSEVIQQWQRIHQVRHTKPVLHLAARVYDHGGHFVQVPAGCSQGLRTCTGGGPREAWQCPMFMPVPYLMHPAHACTPSHHTTRTKDLVATYPATPPIASICPGPSIHATPRRATTCCRLYWVECRTRARTLLNAARTHIAQQCRRAGPCMHAQTCAAPLPKALGPGHLAPEPACNKWGGQE